ncbi:MAG: hypothetical protein EOM10_17290 [Opitutae bacterium]|nr:hypothetical protein [Opitutae bacterium]
MIARAFSRTLWTLVLAGAALLAARMALAGAPLLGGALLAGAAFTAWVYTSSRAHASRYLLPGLAGVAVAFWTLGHAAAGKDGLTFRGVFAATIYGATSGTVVWVLQLLEESWRLAQ